MKKSITIVFLFITIVGFSQRDNEFQIRAGVGLAGYATQNTFTYTWGSFNYSETKNDGAATFHYPIELRYEILERLNVGVDMKFGSYIYDPEEDNAGKSNRFTTVGIAAEFTALNRQNSRIYFGLGINSTRLNLKEVIVDANDQITSEGKWRGSGFKVNAGFIKYFGDSPIGINLNLGYDMHNFDLKELSLRGQNSSVSFDNYSGNLKVSGFDMAAGLVFRLR